MFVFVFIWGAIQARDFFLLMFEHILDAWSSSGVHNMSPVLGGVGGQLLPPLDNQDAGVADLARAASLQLETAAAVALILLTVSEPRAEKKNYETAKISL